MYDHYFDPLRDENCSVAEGRAEMEDVMHSARLLERVVGRIIRFMPEGLSTYDKYYYLAAVICACDSYSNKPENCFTAFGALISGKSVCEGYSKAFYLLCREADLWCAYRFGSSENGEGHIWNMIKLDSGIYNVDVTWCDNTENPCSYKWYSNFAISDSENYYTGHRPSSGPESTGEFEPSPYQYTP